MLGGSGAASSAAGIVILLVCVAALVHCLVTPARYFPAVGQLGKGTWLGLLAAATAAQVFLPLVPPGPLSPWIAPVAWGYGFSLAGIGVLIVGVYLVDTRRKVAALRADAKRRRGPRNVL